MCVRFLHGVVSKFKELSAGYDSHNSLASYLRSIHSRCLNVSWWNANAKKRDSSKFAWMGIQTIETITTNYNVMRLIWGETRGWFLHRSMLHQAESQSIKLVPVVPCQQYILFLSCFIMKTTNLKVKSLSIKGKWRLGTTYCDINSKRFKDIKAEEGNGEAGNCLSSHILSDGKT